MTLSLAVATAEETRGVNLGRIFETIAEAEYEIHWQPEVSAWQVPNRACGLRFTFGSDAVTVEPRSPVGVADDWRFSLSHASAGDEEMVLAPNTFRLDVAQQRATYQHSGMSIEYVNEPGVIRVWYGTAQGLGTSNRSANWKFEGPTEDAQLGYSCAAGDVNGDLLIDLLVGAPDHNSGAGRVLLFDGTSTGLQTTAYWTYNGAQTGARLGHSVWGDVDTNNDGRLDIIVGAPYHDNVTVNEGRVFVFAGSTSPGSPPSLFATLESPGHQAGARFGWAVSGGHLGDLSAAADIIVGAPYYDVNAGDDRGKVFVFWGGNSINLNPDYLDSGLTGTTGEHFGSSLCFIPKILPPPGDLSCLAAGAPEAKVQNLIQAGAVVLWQFVP